MCTDDGADLSPTENLWHILPQKYNKIGPKLLSSWNLISGQNGTTFSFRTTAICLPSSCLAECCFNHTWVNMPQFQPFIVKFFFSDSAIDSGFQIPPYVSRMIWNKSPEIYQFSAFLPGLHIFTWIISKWHQVAFSVCVSSLIINHIRNPSHPS